MTMINTDAPGVTVEVTPTNPAPFHPAQVRFQSWVQNVGDDDEPFTHLVDLRFTPEMIPDLINALVDAAHDARVANADWAAFVARRQQIFPTDQGKP